MSVERTVVCSLALLCATPPFAPIRTSFCYSRLFTNQQAPLTQGKANQFKEHDGFCERASGSPSKDNGASSVRPPAKAGGEGRPKEDLPWSKDLVDTPTLPRCTTSESSQVRDSGHSDALGQLAETTAPQVTNHASFQASLLQASESLLAAMQQLQQQQQQQSNEQIGSCMDEKRTHHYVSGPPRKRVSAYQNASYV
uniref:Uncharacterized protein n=1 Tax=Haptolina brevifila TaxID=156173 RepID=A0A7S2BUT8_9EUKA|mmetsp:Transcript_17013/g.34418  ORF Transcript_17013/g.34418 Transcript_17013/m.34418 type:complete len:197 (+) Transcript_17013:413-1003(+)